MLAFENLNKTPGNRFLIVAIALLLLNDCNRIILETSLPQVNGNRSSQSPGPGPVITTQFYRRDPSSLITPVTAPEKYSIDSKSIIGCQMNRLSKFFLRPIHHPGSISASEIVVCVMIRLVTLGLGGLFSTMEPLHRTVPAQSGKHNVIVWIAEFGVDLNRLFTLSGSHRSNRPENCTSIREMCVLLPLDIRQLIPYTKSMASSGLPFICNNWSTQQRSSKASSTASRSSSLLLNTHFDPIGDTSPSPERYTDHFSTLQGKLQNHIILRDLP